MLGREVATDEIAASPLSAFDTTSNPSSSSIVASISRTCLVSSTTITRMVMTSSVGRRAELLQAVLAVLAQHRRELHRVRRPRPDVELERDRAGVAARAQPFQERADRQDALRQRRVAVPAHAEVVRQV